MLFEIVKTSFAYQEKIILEDISIELEPGRFYGILGPNGSGKTTFLDLLFRYKEPTNGLIQFKGRDLKDFKPRELGREVSFVPQDFYLNFPFTVQEIVLMGRYPHLSRFSAFKEKDYKKSEQAMLLTGIACFKNQYITKLSGGEKQRVVLARALAQDAPLMILDEPTSSLDVKYSMNLLRLLKQMHQKENKTIIAVLHDLNQAACFCDYLLFFKSGRLKSHGPIDDVLTSELVEQVFEVQAKVKYESFAGCYQIIFKAKN